MALNQSALDEIAAMLKNGDSFDLVRSAAELVLQALIEAEAEATARIGAERYERTETRTSERNVHRERTLSTKAGDLTLKIPKFRQGSFFPSMLEPRRRIGQALYAHVMEAYVQGVSTRSVDELVEALGIESGISRSEVSRICAALDEQVQAFFSRRLDHAPFPYVILDATYLHVREDHKVISKAVVIATGINDQGGPGGAGGGGRRFRGGGLLGALYLRAVPKRAHRGAAGHLGPACRTGGRHPAPPAGGCPSAVSGLLCRPHDYADWIPLPQVPVINRLPMSA